MRILIFLSLIVFASCDNTQISTKGIDLNLAEKFRFPDNIVYRSSMEIIDTTYAEKMGMLLFFKNTTISKTACADCHDPNNSFYAPVAEHQGGGLYRKMNNEIAEWHYTGSVWHTPIDEQPNKKSPTSANLWKRKDKVLSAGLEGLPGELQFGKAFDAHFMQDLIVSSKHDQLLNEMSKIAFDTIITKETVACAVSIYQQGIISNQNNINKYLRGQSKGLFSPQGMQLYVENCMNCHESQDMGKSFSSNMDSVLTPNLEQVKDSPCFFDDCQTITHYNAIKAHGLELNQSEIYKIRRFIEKDLHDPNMMRYTKI